MTLTVDTIYIMRLHIIGHRALASSSKESVQSAKRTALPKTPYRHGSRFTHMLLEVLNGLLQKWWWEKLASMRFMGKTWRACALVVLEKCVCAYWCKRNHVKWQNKKIRYQIHQNGPLDCIRLLLFTRCAKQRITRTWKAVKHSACWKDYGPSACIPKLLWIQ